MENQCVYITKKERDIFNYSFKPTKIHPIRPYSKRVTLEIQEIKPNKPVNSLDGISASVNTLGVQFERLRAELSNFEIAPKIDDMFYFLLGTQKLTFYCKNQEGKVYKVKTFFESIPSNQWEY
jgi:hypothetical protein